MTSAAAVPFAGYERLDDREVRKELSQHSQVELEAVETYERSHQNRKVILDKLRYLRGREPIPGYDGLAVPEIVAALADADLVTIKRIRGYERKFANRAAVLDEAVQAHHRRLEARPAAAPPAYQPMSAKPGPDAP
jgi:hypothetical protein